MWKLSQRRQEIVVTVFTNFILFSISFLFALCFYFSNTNRDRFIVGAGFLGFLSVSYLLSQLESWISRVNNNRGNYSDEKEIVEKLV